MRPHFCFSSNSARWLLRTRATTIAVVAAIAMMRTTATTPPMMATVLSELEDGVSIVGGVDTLSTSNAGAVHQHYPQRSDICGDSKHMHWGT